MPFLIYLSMVTIEKTMLIETASEHLRTRNKILISLQKPAIQIFLAPFSIFMVQHFGFLEKRQNPRINERNVGG